MHINEPSQLRIQDIRTSAQFVGLIETQGRGARHTHVLLDVDTFRIAMVESQLRGEKHTHFMHDADAS